MPVTCWEELKELQCDFVPVELSEMLDQEQLSERKQKQDEAVEKAMLEDDSSTSIEKNEEVAEEDRSNASSVDSDDSISAPFVCCIRATKYVVKWHHSADSRQRELFNQKVKKLATGERGRKLAKRLVGCKSLIYETYLEQTRGVLTTT